MKIPHIIKKNASNATAIASIMNPIYAAVETSGAGMSHAVSIGSRLMNTGLMYAGLASLVELRKATRKLVGITRKTKEVWKYLHDIGFAVTLIGTIKPVIYLIAGETDWRKILAGTAAGLLIGGGTAAPMGKIIDVYGELTGVEESERTPTWIKRRSSRFKRGLAAALVAVGITATSLVYSFTPDRGGRNYTTSQPAIQSSYERSQPNSLERSVEELNKD